MAFKFITVLFATLAFANAGLLPAQYASYAAPLAKIAYSPASEVSHVYSSIQLPAHPITPIAHAAPVAVAHAAPAISYAAPQYAVAHAAPQYAAPQYAVAHAASQYAVAHAAPQYAAPQYAVAHAAPHYAISSPAIGSSQVRFYLNIDI